MPRRNHNTISHGFPDYLRLLIQVNTVCRLWIAIWIPFLSASHGSLVQAA